MIEALPQVADVALPSRPGREHHVTAVVVTHNGRRWLPRSLAALAGSSRTPDRLIAVDTGSQDASRRLLADSGMFDPVLEAPADTGFGQAVALAAAELAADEVVPDVIDLTGPTIDLRDGVTRPEPDPQPATGTVEWLWLLHDDCAVSADALAQLLATADRYPDAAVVGPKVRGWAHPDVVLQAGMTVTPAGRLETWTLPGEVDQGQYDHRLDVLAVGSAGMLVRRDVWERLGGFDPALPLFRDDLDFCWRARLAGERVVVATRALIHHRQASYHGRRPGLSDPLGKRHQMRRASVFNSLVHTPTWRLPLRLVRLLFATLVRVVADLLSLSPRRAYADLRANLSGIFSWRQLRRSRAAVRAVATTDPRDLRWLRPTLAERAIHWQETFAAFAERGDEEHVTAADRLKRSLTALGGVVIPLLIVCIAAAGSLWFASGELSGGALLPVPESAVDVWQSFLSPWHEVGLGSAVPAPTYLSLVTAVAVILLGSATMAVAVLLLLAPVLAAVSALIALRGFTSRGIGIVTALVYALLPATIAAVGTGRLGTAAAAILLPLTARSIARMTGLVQRLPRHGWRSVAAAVLWTAALASFVPTLAMVLLAVAAGVALVKRAGRTLGRVVLVAALVVVLLWPWSGYLLTNPGLLLFEIGADPPDLAGLSATPLDLLALNPGGPASPPVVLALPLLVLAVLALAPGRTRGAALLGWVTILVALIVGTVQITSEIMVPSSALPVTPWPGAMALLIGAAALFAAATAAGQLGTKGTVVARGGAVVAAITAVILAGWWIFAQQSLVTRGDSGTRSAFVTSESMGPGAPRSLVIGESDGPRSVVNYQILSGPGPQMGDAEVAPDAAVMAGMNQAVARLVTGGSDAALATLAGASVQYISVDTRDDRGLARRLDAVPGLRRVSTVDGRGLWSVSGWLPRVRSRDGAGAAQPIPVSGVSPALTVAAPLPAGAGSIELGETASGLWQAAVGGQGLVPGTDANGQQTFTVPAGAAGDVAIMADTGPRMQQLLIAVLGLIVVALMFVFARRRQRALRPPSRSMGREGPLADDLFATSAAADTDDELDVVR